MSVCVFLITNDINMLCMIFQEKALSESSQTQAYKAFDASVTAALGHLCSALRTKCCKKWCK